MADLSSRDVPLCVDLDGTLLKSDVLLESFVAALRHAPWILFVAPFWLLRGRAHLKRQLALRGAFDVATLPYDETFLARLRQDRAGGRRIWLATAADATVAERIAAYLGCFDGTIASDGLHNLKREAKARALVERFGEKGFDYAGEDRHDVPVWKHAREAVVVPREPAKPWRWLRALRAYQWAKNLLLFVPVATSHHLDAGTLRDATLAFVAFCLVASAGYLVNDLLDLASDRSHATKRHRALAAGEVPITAALALIPLLLALAAAVCGALSSEFSRLLAAYLVASLAYSGWLKRIVLVDVFVLAGLYALRIIAGAAAIAVPLSPWLLGFSMFAFLSIALAKRYVEVDRAKVREAEAISGRGYRPGDAALLGMFGIGCACLAALVLALYITSPQVTTLYRHPGVLWFAVPLVLYWLARMWLLAHRRLLNEDPLIFAVRDAVSVATILLVGAVMFVAA